MKTRDFDFELPEELIAQHPPAVRGSERLMVVDPATGALSHRAIAELPALLEPGTLMVVNDSRVRKARVFAQPIDEPRDVAAPGAAPRTAAPGEADQTAPRSGFRDVEFLLVERIDSWSWKVLCSRAKRQRPGQRYRLEAGVEARIEGADGELRIVRFDPPIDDAWLDRHGHVPLPPYIKRPDTPEDEERYQTVYARVPGSIAAPTAGLHLTPELLAELDRRGVQTARVTLHVGLGTFLPIRTEEVEAHTMHEERYEIDDAAADAVNRARREGRPILAVGTTSVRTLEAAGQGGTLRAGSGSTRLYIYPGYRFSIVDRLLTNFHTPGSSLVLLVAAFGGSALMRRAYAEAVKERYRFFSYGDAMLIRGRAAPSDQ